jgi:hypothetical protein
VDGIGVTQTGSREATPIDPTLNPAAFHPAGGETR